MEKYGNNKYLTSRKETSLFLFHVFFTELVILIPTSLKAIFYLRYLESLLTLIGELKFSVRYKLLLIKAKERLKGNWVMEIQLL